MIVIKSKNEVNKVRESCRIAVDVCRILKEEILPGVETHQLNKRAEEMIRKKKAEPAFLGYRGFPASICVSVNEEVVHGIPKRKKLQEGDILSLDIGVLYNGYYADMAFTTAVGRISERAKKLIAVTKESLYCGIEKMCSGNRLGDVSNAVQLKVESNNFSVVRDFVGHGIGARLHEDPQIPNYGSPNSGPLLKEGMVFALEPMVNSGGWETEVLDDNWTVVTKDGSFSAHFEHTVALTVNGPEILTEW
ncbi:type I methionyl aminopeptidase [bacterium]|nr:type I methionyl aminopeptidase [bacterium]